MPFKILDGKKLSKSLQVNITTLVRDYTIKNLRAPSLAVILLGNNPASRIYVSIKQKICHEVGIKFNLHHFSDNIPEKILLNLIHELNENRLVDGILIQLPLPIHINSNKILSQINHDKDVDGLHPYNMGNFILGNPTLIPCTVKGIITLLKANNIELKGLNSVIVGASTTVGKPIAIGLINEKCTVTVCRKTTCNLPSIVKQADLIVSAVGIPKLICTNMVKIGAIVVDVGINRLANGKIVGDVDFDLVKNHTSFITPVPGGIGPMTIAMLLENVLYIANNLLKK